MRVVLIICLWCVAYSNASKASCICGYGGVCRFVDGRPVRWECSTSNCEHVSGGLYENCSTLENHCKSDPCANGGACVMTFGSFFCECPPEYIGRLCQYRRSAELSDLSTVVGPRAWFQVNKFSPQTNQLVHFTFEEPGDSIQLQIRFNDGRFREIAENTFKLTNAKKECIRDVSENPRKRDIRVCETLLDKVVYSVEIQTGFFRDRVSKPEAYVHIPSLGVDEGRVDFIHIAVINSGRLSFSQEYRIHNPLALFPKCESYINFYGCSRRKLLHILHDASRPITLRAVREPAPNCTATIVRMIWRFPATGTEVRHRHHNTVTLDEKYVKRGENYVDFTVILKGDSGYYGSADLNYDHARCWFKTVLGPFNVGIHGGLYRTVPCTSPLTLRLFSLNPNYQENELVSIWWCTTNHQGKELETCGKQRYLGSKIFYSTLPCGIEVNINAIVLHAPSGQKVNLKAGVETTVHIDTLVCHCSYNCKPTVDPRSKTKMWIDDRRLSTDQRTVPIRWKAWLTSKMKPWSMEPFIVPETLGREVEIERFTFRYLEPEVVKDPVLFVRAEKEEIFCEMVLTLEVPFKQLRTIARENVYRADVDDIRNQLLIVNSNAHLLSQPYTFEAYEIVRPGVLEPIETIHAGRTKFSLLKLNHPTFAVAKNDRGLPSQIMVIHRKHKIVLKPFTVEEIKHMLSRAKFIIEQGNSDVALTELIYISRYVMVLPQPPLRLRRKLLNYLDKISRDLFVGNPAAIASLVSKALTIINRMTVSSDLTKPPFNVDIKPWVAPSNNMTPVEVLVWNKMRLSATTVLLKASSQYYQCSKITAVKTLRLTKKLFDALLRYALTRLWEPYWSRVVLSSFQTNDLQYNTENAQLHETFDRTVNYLLRSISHQLQGYEDQLNIDVGTVTFSSFIFPSNRVDWVGHVVFNRYQQVSIRITLPDSDIADDSAHERVSSFLGVYVELPYLTEMTTRVHVALFHRWTEEEISAKIAVQMKVQKPINEDTEIDADQLIVDYVKNPSTREKRQKYVIMYMIETSDSDFISDNVDRKWNVHIVSEVDIKFQVEPDVPKFEEVSQSQAYTHRDFNVSFVTNRSTVYLAVIPSEKVDFSSVNRMRPPGALYGQPFVLHMCLTEKRSSTRLRISKRLSDAEIGRIVIQTSADSVRSYFGCRVAKAFLQVTPEIPRKIEFDTTGFVCVLRPSSSVAAGNTVDKELCQIAGGDNVTNAASVVTCICQGAGIFDTFKIHSHLIKMLTDQINSEERAEKLEVSLPPIWIVPPILLAIFLISCWRDKRNHKREFVQVLEDSFPGETHPYIVGVFTGKRLFAWTDAKVAIQIHGNSSSSRVHILKSKSFQTLRWGQDDWFLIYTNEHLGLNLQLCMWQNFEGSCPNWLCSHVMIYDVEDSTWYRFQVQRWLRISEGIRFCRTLLVHGNRFAPESVNMLNFTFFKHYKRLLRNANSLTSVFVKHRRHVFSYRQKAVLVSLFLLSLICSASIVEDVLGTGNNEMGANIFQKALIALAPAFLFLAVVTCVFMRSYVSTRKTTKLDLRKVHDFKTFMAGSSAPTVTKQRSREEWNIESIEIYHPPQHITSSRVHLRSLSSHMSSDRKFDSVKKYASFWKRSRPEQELWKSGTAWHQKSIIQRWTPETSFRPIRFHHELVYIRYGGTVYIVIAWLLAAVIIVLALVYLILHLDCGENVPWIICIAVALDVLVVEPVALLILSLYSVYGTKVGNFECNILELLGLPVNRKQIIHKEFIDVVTQPCYFPQPSERLERLHKQYMNRKLSRIFFYFLFIFVFFFLPLVWLGWQSDVYNAWRVVSSTAIIMREPVKNIHVETVLDPLSKTYENDGIATYLLTVCIPATSQRDWYNGKRMSTGKKAFTWFIDRHSKLYGSTVIRILKATNKTRMMVSSFFERYYSEAYGQFDPYMNKTALISEWHEVPLVNSSSPTFDTIIRNGIFGNSGTFYQQSVGQEVFIRDEKKHRALGIYKTMKTSVTSLTRALIVDMNILQPSYAQRYLAPRYGITSVEILFENAAAGPYTGHIYAYLDYAPSTNLDHSYFSVALYSTLVLTFGIYTAVKAMEDGFTVLFKYRYFLTTTCAVLGLVIDILILKYYISSHVDAEIAKNVDVNTHLNFMSHIGFLTFLNGLVGSLYLCLALLLSDLLAECIGMKGRLKTRFLQLCVAAYFLNLTVSKFLETAVGSYDVILTPRMSMIRIDANSYSYKSPTLYSFVLIWMATEAIVMACFVNGFNWASSPQVFRCLSLCAVPCCHRRPKELSKKISIGSWVSPLLTTKIEEEERPPSEEKQKQSEQSTSPGISDRLSRVFRMWE